MWITEEVGTVHSENGSGFQSDPISKFSTRKILEVGELILTILFIK